MPAVSATICPEAKAVGVAVSTYGLTGTPKVRELVNQVAPNYEDQFIEVMLAVNFAVRQLSSLGGGREADELVHRLENLHYEEAPGVTLLKDIRGLSVVTSSRRLDGVKRIDVELRFAGETFQLWVKKYAVRAAELQVSVAELLSHPHRRTLVAHLAGQPQLCVTVADTPLDSAVKRSS